MHKWSQHTWCRKHNGIFKQRKKTKQVEAGGEVNHTEKLKKLSSWLLLPPELWCKARVMLRTWVMGRTEWVFFCVLLTSCSPESTSRRRISMRPSRRSVYKSPMRQVTRPKWEFTHLVKVFFCTASRSSVKDIAGRERAWGHITPKLQLSLGYLLFTENKPFQGIKRLLNRNIVMNFNQFFQQRCCSKEERPKLLRLWSSFHI